MESSKETQKSQILPLLPLRDLIIFPHMMMPLFVGREKSIRALEEANKKQTDIVLVAQKEAKTNDPKPEELYSIGTTATIIQLLRLPDGTVKVLVEGKKRVKIKKFEQTKNFFLVKAVDEIEKPISNKAEMWALVRSVKTTFGHYVKLNRRIPPEILMRVTSIENISEFTNIITAQINLRVEDKQKILEVNDLGKKLEELFHIMTGEIEILEVEKKIRNRVKTQMEKSQKEYYLNEQMQAIQKELGEKDDYQMELDEIEDAVKKKSMSKEAREKAHKEIKKLRMMSPLSAEAAVIRNYLDWIVELPWCEYEKGNKDIGEAERVLEEHHCGLEKVKERILEHLAVQFLTNKLQGPILCLTGPPGVGKTSLAKSIAIALNRPFARISLGGVRDEAEIRGHRRTYVGAMPGKIIQTLKKCSKGNPLLLLDEIDKMSMDFRGDPSSALLEVLDPEQNRHFNDHYLEVDYDLSKVMFITTANSLHPIPRPLIDRMEVIPINSYIEKEKFNIARKHLIPKQLNLHGFKDIKVNFVDSAIHEVIRYYTKEAGVRELERKVATIFRKLAKDVVKRDFKKDGKKLKKNSRKEKQMKRLKKEQKKSYIITLKKVKEYLGFNRYPDGKIEGQNEIGLTNGMAWTELGGDLLPVEVSVVPGKGKFTLTGQLGDVMKESCSAAMSYVRSRGPLFNFDKEFYSNIDVHIHAPEGAIPKDGPSAGIAIVTSIVSAITKTRVLHHVAMTGEITLRGRVLQIGGLKEKILAAHRGGITKILVPKENEKDLRDIPKEVLKDITVVLVDHVDQVLINALDIKDAKEIFKIPSSPSMGLYAHYTGHTQSQQH